MLMMIVRRHPQLLWPLLAISLTLLVAGLALLLA